MNIYNSEFYLQLATHLSTLQASDFLEDDAGYDPFAPSAFVVPGIDNKTKKRVYADNDFKKYLKEYIKRKFNIKKDTITDEYSEEIYRKMYHKDLAKNHSYNLFTKVMYHPDVTNSDYEYISNKRARFFKNILYSELACFSIMLFTYYKTPFGKKLRNNMGMGIAVLGVAPIVTLFASQKLNAVLLNWKIRKMNLPTKYHIKDA